MRHEETHPDAVSAIKTIHRRKPTNPTPPLTDKYILPEGMTMTGFKEIMRKGQTASAIIDLQRWMLQDYISRIERSIAYRHQTISTNLRNLRYMYLTVMRARQELRCLAVQLAEAQSAVNSKWMKVLDPPSSPYISVSGRARKNCFVSGGPKRPVCEVDSYTDSCTVSKLLRELGYGPDRTWASLTEEEIGGIYSCMEEWEKYKGYHVRPTGRDRNVFATEHDALKRAEREKWKAQNKARKGGKARKGVPMAGDERRIEGLRGGAMDVMWDWHEIY
ncbi:hypothetical protein HDU67_007701 [Dinochytrium kinnereticum]|nr:hypothetical protein HDU67_007701 [Dinochytrium kinnereticum]